MTLALQTLISILAWAGIALMTVFWTALIAAVWLVHPVADPKLRLAHRLASLWGRGLVRAAVGTQVKVIGQANIPRGRPVIFVANHQSYVDVPTLFFVPGRFKWMADADLFRIPVLGWAMAMAGYIPVRRGDPRQGIRALERARQWIAQGISIFIFPEGTRSRTGVLRRFQTGSFRLAAEAHAPIVPVVLIGTRQLLPRGSWVFRWGVRIQVRILPPILPPTDRKAARRLAQQTREQMRAAYRRTLPQVRP